MHKLTFQCFKSIQLRQKLIDNTISDTGIVVASSAENIPKILNDNRLTHQHVRTRMMKKVIKEINARFNNLTKTRHQAAKIS